MFQVSRRVGYPSYVVLRPRGARAWTVRRGGRESGLGRAGSRRAAGINQNFAYLEETRLPLRYTVGGTTATNRPRRARHLAVLPSALPLPLSSPLSALSRSSRSRARLGILAQVAVLIFKVDSRTPLVELVVAEDVPPHLL